MKRALLVWAAAAIAAMPSWSQTAARPAPPKVKLVLAITVDQFRYDYLVRFRDSYHAGLARLWKQGAVFSNAHYEHFPTVTAIGHSTLLSGALPTTSGIVGNEWYDRELGKQVTSVEDAAHKLVGATGTGASPKYLLVSTLSDEMKMAARGKPKAFGISIKDRSAILPIGRMGDGAFWFDDETGNFVSSTYYGARLPEWVDDFNRRRDADKFLAAEWKPIDNPRGELFRKMEIKASQPYYAAMERTPYGNELLLMLAQRAVTGEKLGQREETDLLSVSFSSNDYVGHDYGPDSPRVRDISIRTDRTLGQLFDFLDKQVGMRNVLVVLTADHGVAPLPELMVERKMPGARRSRTDLHKRIQARLTELYGEGTWILGRSGPAPYFNLELMLRKKLDLAEVRERAAEVVRASPHMARVYTRDQLAKGQVPGDPVDRRVLNGFHAQRSSDLFIVSEPYHMFEEKGTSHGSPYNYDSHVPIILMGPGVKPGKYLRRAAVNDIAPTLASLLEVEAPSGSIGRILEEALY